MRTLLRPARVAHTCVAVHLLVAACAAPAYAQPTPLPRGATALEHAHAAWNRGDFDTAETLFKEALDQGGLPRESALDANVYLGSARAVIGRKEPALVAFRYAALLDPNFAVPPEAGKKAIHLAGIAKKQTARIGQMVMHTDVPSRVPSGQPFQVNVSLDPGHAAILTRVGLQVTDGLTPRGYSYEQTAAANMRFTVPASVTLPDANLTVRLVGLDGKDNEYVTAESKVNVEPAPKKLPTPIIDVYAESTKAGRAAKSGGAANADKGTGHGFFTTAWPFVIGGVVLAGGAAAVYFVTRPGDSVTVSQTHVQAIQ